MMMKKISAMVTLLFMLLTHVTVMAQDHAETITRSSIRPMPLAITFGKTTNLIFPYAIKSVDKGSKDVLAQIAKGVENILQIKAARQGFDETNLTVVTADARLYSYVLNYTSYPSELNIKMGNSPNYPTSDALFSYKTDNEAKVYDLAQQLILKKPLIKNLRSHRDDVGMSLSGVYNKEDKLYFQFALENSSNLDYTIESLRFFIRDLKQAKRTASQENEIKALQVAGNSEIIRGKSMQSIIVVLPKFTIPDKKAFYVQLMEQNGGRNLELRIKNKIIVDAKPAQ